MLPDKAREQLGWPSRDTILQPEGPGAKIYAQLANDKIGQAIRRLPGGDDTSVGVLAADPDSTAMLLAIVCEFPRPVSDATLRETHRLAWNFCRAPLLITIEPHIVRTWTCYEPPATPSDELSLEFHTQPSIGNATPEIGGGYTIDPDSGSFVSEQASQSLHWIELVSQHFFKKNEERFHREHRADRNLLANLRHVRQKLLKLNLSDDISHDLLARIIFIQFLMDRKDVSGTPALNTEELRRLHAIGVLSEPYTDFGSILL